MKKELFNELLESVKQAGEILRQERAKKKLDQEKPMQELPETNYVPLKRA